MSNNNSNGNSGSRLIVPLAPLVDTRMAYAPTPVEAYEAGYKAAMNTVSMVPHDPYNPSRNNVRMRERSPESSLFRSASRMDAGRPFSVETESRGRGFGSAAPTGSELDRGYGSTARSFSEFGRMESGRGFGSAAQSASEVNHMVMGRGSSTGSEVRRMEFGRGFSSVAYKPSAEWGAVVKQEEAVVPYTPPKVEPSHEGILVNPFTKAYVDQRLKSFTETIVPQINETIKVQVEDMLATHLIGLAQRLDDIDGKGVPFFGNRIEPVVETPPQVETMVAGPGATAEAKKAEGRSTRADTAAQAAKAAAAKAVKAAAKAAMTPDEVEAAKAAKKLKLAEAKAKHLKLAEVARIAAAEAQAVADEANDLEDLSD